MNLNPIGLVIAAVIALVAGFIYLWNTSEGFRNFWIGLWEGIQNVVGAAVDWIVSAWNGMTEFFSNAWDGLVDGSKQAVDSVKKGMAGYQAMVCRPLARYQRFGKRYVARNKASI
jgi:hypothetical protein